MKNKIEIKKQETTKQLFFREVLEAFINGGYDFTLDNGQTEIRYYIPDAMFSIVLNINGTWKRD